MADHRSGSNRSPDPPIGVLFWACAMWVGLAQRSKNSYFKNRAQISSIFGVETAIFLLKTHQHTSGASPPTCADGF